MEKNLAAEKSTRERLSSAISNGDFFATLSFCHSLDCPPEAEKPRWFFRVFRGYSLFEWPESRPRAVASIESLRSQHGNYHPT
jgi:hypothetical protein